MLDPCAGICSTGVAALLGAMFPGREDVRRQTCRTDVERLEVAIRGEHCTRPQGRSQPAHFWPTPESEPAAVPAGVEPRMPCDRAANSASETSPASASG